MEGKHHHHCDQYTAFDKTNAHGKTNAGACPECGGGGQSPYTVAGDDNGSHADETYAAEIGQSGQPFQESRDPLTSASWVT